MFDELGAARTLAQLIIDEVLQPERLARVATQASHDATALGIGEVVDTLMATTAARSGDDPHQAALRRIAQRAVIDRMLGVAADRDVATEVRDRLELRLVALRTQAVRRATAPGSDAVRAHWLGIARDLGRWLDDREAPPITPALPSPPFDPFGEEG